MNVNTTFRETLCFHDYLGVLFKYFYIIILCEKHMIVN
jgi:hypothetical protein